MKHFFILFIALLFTGGAQGLYFLLGNGPSKCFTVEQPKDIPIVFSYEILDSGHSVDFELFYGTSAKSSLLIMKKVLSDLTGHIDFTADNDGPYAICVQQASSVLNTGSVTRFSLLIKYGYDSEYYEKLSKQHSFDATNMDIHKLNDMMTMIMHEADFQKHKEVIFHRSTERMNSAVLWWPLLQITILVLTGIFQVQHLKNFFKSTQLI